MPFSTRPQAAEPFEEHPINYNPDQEANFNPQLRRLNMKLLLNALIGIVSDPPATLLLGGTFAALLRRKYLLASFFAAGFALQQTAARPPGPKGRGRSLRQREELEFERLAMKAQRGDYGRLEVIAFK